MDYSVINESFWIVEQEDCKAAHRFPLLSH